VITSRVDHHTQGRDKTVSKTCKDGLKKLGRGSAPALGGLSDLRQPWQRAACPCDQQLVTDFVERFTGGEMVGQRNLLATKIVPFLLESLYLHTSAPNPRPEHVGSLLAGAQLLIPHF
jgi:hypothetical protein